MIKDEGVDNTMMMINLCRQHEPNDDNDDQILPIGPKLNFSTTNSIVNHCHHRCKSQKKSHQPPLDI